MLGLVWRGSQLLVSEVQDDAGRIKGVRPLGGSVEFGEPLDVALVREFAEELGCGIECESGFALFENIYVHEGHTGHEIAFAARIRLNDRSFYERDEFVFHEADGTACLARWLDPASLPSDLALYPDGLSSWLADAELDKSTS